jgi:uncharacterized membrane protein YeaQ/YmgE (transglycosylase-associated protein family)
MIVGLVIVFGAVAGLIAFAINGSGYGLWWDVILGIAGSIISSVIMTAAYLMNHFGKADTIGFNWYSMTVGAIGALALIYGGWLYKRANAIEASTRKS